MDTLKANEICDFDNITEVIYPFTKGKVNYILREASGEAVARYRNAMGKAIKLGPEGKPVSIDGLADAEFLLVSLCVFVGEVSVSISLIKSWPYRIQKVLLEKIHEISPINDKETPDAINKQIEALQAKLAAPTTEEASKN